MAANLTLSVIMVVITTLVHLVGMLGLLRVLDVYTRHPKHHTDLLERVRQVAVIAVVVLGLFAVHGVEIALYAFLYLHLGVIETVEAAFYFSMSTFTTVGFGDITLDEDWRMLSAAESMNGFVLIGWSTAFLFSVTSRLHALER